MNPLNAIITSCDILESEHYQNCLVLSVSLSLQGGGCVVFSISCPHSKDYSKNMLGYAIKRVIDIAGVYDFSKVVGSPVRALFENEGQFGDSIIGIGHFLKDDWLIPNKEEIFTII